MATVNDNDPRVEYTATASQTTFTRPFFLNAEADLDVYVNGTLTASGYTHTGVGANSGTIVFSSGRTAGDIIILSRSTAAARSSAYTDGQPVPASSFEDDNTRALLLQQEAVRDVRRSIRAPITDTDLDADAGDLELPAKADRASKYLVFAADGKTLLPSAGTGTDTGLREDLADTATVGNGDTLIGGKRTLASAVAFTLHGYHENRVINFVVDYGADPTGVSDCSALLETAITEAAGRPIYFPAGTYKFLSQVSASVSFTLLGDGDATILDFTDGAFSAAEYGIEVEGTLTQIEELGGDPTAGDTTVTFASAPSLSIGDVFVIYNPTDSSWSGFRTYYRAGEWCQVESISGSTVTLKNPLYDGYTAANVDVYKLAGPTPVIRDMKINGEFGVGLVNFMKCYRPRLENVNFNHEDNSCVNMNRCYGVRVVGCNGINYGDGGDDYGIAIGSSQDILIDGGYWYGRRHAIATGGGDYVGQVPTRNFRVISATLKNDPASGVHCADFHGDTEDGWYDHCTIYGGASLAGKDTGYNDCVITNQSNGMVVTFTEIKGGDFYLDNIEARTNVNPGATSRGILDIGGNSDVITDDTTLPVTVHVRNLTLYGRNLSASTSWLIRMVCRGATVATNFEVDGVTCDVDALDAILRTDYVSGTADADFIIVDNINNAPSGTFLSLADASYRDFPHRLMRQSGYVDAACTSGNQSSTASAQTYRYPYPRRPIAQVSHGSTDGVGKNTWGGRTVASYVQAISTTAITPQVRTGAETNFSSTENVRLFWTVAIEDI